MTKWKKLLLLSAFLIFACDVVYLEDNGVTIKACPDANIGDVGTINGVDYTVVDRQTLINLVNNINLN